MRIPYRKKFIKIASELELAQKAFDFRDNIVDTSISNLIVDEEVKNHQLKPEDVDGYVIFPLIPGYFDQCLRFCVLAHAFRIQGFKPLIIRDEYDLPTLPYRPVEHRANETGESWYKSEMYRYASKKYPAEFGLQSYTIGELIHDEPEIRPDDASVYESCVYDGYQLAECAKATSRKYFMRYNLNFDDNEVRSIYKQFLSGGSMIVSAVTSLIDKYDILGIIAIEPNYIHGKLPLEVGVKNNIPAYALSKGYHQGEVMFRKINDGVYSPRHISRESSHRATDISLSSGMHKKIESLIEDRKNDKITRADYNAGKRSYIRSNAENVVGVFTNLLWDGSLEFEQAIYSNVFNWLEDTIDILKQQDNIEIFIKIHPAEEIRGTNESFIDFINQRYPDIPDKFTIIRPDSDINTYELINELDAGIVYSSTVGLEMSMEGVPVLVGGYPPYINADFAHTPSNKEEYSHRLRSITSLEYDAEMERSAKKFGYYLFVCKQIEFPYFSKYNSGEQVEVRHEEISQKSSVYKYCVSQIIEDAEIVDIECEDMVQ